MSSVKITDNTELNDVRTSFRGITFSNFKKLDAKNQFVESMKKGKVEPACYWCAELICSGHYMDIWEIILHYMSKYIHLGNPKIVVYLEKRFTVFKNIMSQGHFLSELHLRNNNNMRKLFAEMISVLTISNKKHSFEAIKINRVEEFDMTLMADKLKAPSVSYIEPMYKPKDPKEIFIPLNELAYHISRDSLSMLNACYWIEWIIEFDLICKKRKEQCKCERRSQYDVENKLQGDIIWMVWDTLLYYCESQKDTFVLSIMNSLVTLFCIKYTNASPKKRRYLLYFAVALITEQVPTNIDMIADKTIVQNVVEQINHIYKQIKKNEVTPGVDYLFNGLEQHNNFEKTIQKMDIMNKLDHLDDDIP
jgi:hypothetical protein